MAENVHIHYDILVIWVWTESIDRCTRTGPYFTKGLYEIVIQILYKTRVLYINKYTLLASYNYAHASIAEL